MCTLLALFILIKIKKWDGRLITLAWPKMLTNTGSLFLCFSCLWVTFVSSFTYTTYINYLELASCCYSQFVEHLAKWGPSLPFCITNSISTTPGKKKKSQNWALPHALNLSSLILWNGGKVKSLQVMKEAFIFRLEFTAFKELITQLTQILV